MRNKNTYHNFFYTFIEVAEDTKSVTDKNPTSKNENKTIAEMQYELIFQNSNNLTSDDIFFSDLCRQKRFEKYNEGKVALYGMDTEQYQKLLNDTKIKKIKAMGSTKKR